MVHGAGVVVVNDAGEVLMQHRDNKPGIFYPDYWGYPAGSVEEGEDFKEAAKRELKEESGYVAEELYELVDETYTRTDGETVNRHIYWTRYDGKQAIQLNEGQEMRFVSHEFLTDKKMLPGQDRIIKLAIEKAGILKKFTK